MGTKNNPGKFDCYHRAAPDEPMFVLLARDRQAPQRVLDWAAERSVKRPRDPKIEEARQCAADMIRWRKRRSIATQAIVGASYTQAHRAMIRLLLAPASFDGSTFHWGTHKLNGFRRILKLFGANKITEVSETDAPKVIALLRVWADAHAK